MELETKLKVFHLVFIFGSVIQIAFISACLGDGQSVVTLKDDADLPVALTLKGNGSAPLVNLHLRQILFHPYTSGQFAPYGIGVEHDSFGRTWNDHGPGKNLKEIMGGLVDRDGSVEAAVLTVLETRTQFHPASFLSCDGLASRGVAAVVFCIIGAILAFFQIVVSSAFLLRGTTMRCPALSFVTQSSLFLGFMIVLILIQVIFTTEWTCDNALIPKLKVDDHFDMNYALTFAIIGMLASLTMCTLAAYLLYKMMMSEDEILTKPEAVAEMARQKDAEMAAALAKQRKDMKDEAKTAEEKILKSQAKERAAALEKVNKEKDHVMEAALEKLKHEKEKEQKEAVDKTAKTVEKAGEKKLSTEVSTLKELTQKEKEDELKRLEAVKEREKKAEVNQLNEQMNKLGVDKDQRIFQLEGELQDQIRDKESQARIHQQATDKGCLPACAGMMPGVKPSLQPLAEPVPEPGSSWV